LVIVGGTRVSGQVGLQHTDGGEGVTSATSHASGKATTWIDLCL
jgi:hypothetical protein